MTEVKPCPFCGEIPKMTTEVIKIEEAQVLPIITIECNSISCGVQLFSSNYHISSVTADWNTRAPSKDREFLIELSDPDIHPNEFQERYTWKEAQLIHKIRQYLEESR